MIRLITFSNDAMTQSGLVCQQAAMEHGCDEARIYHPFNIDSQFVQFNRDIFNQSRGVGYWIWKPYFIYLNALELRDGDILIYCDAGVKLINNVRHIIDVMDQDLFLFSNGHQHVHWCKADVYNAVNYWETVAATRTDCGEWKEFNQEYVAYQQVQASVIFIKVNPETRNFIKEWLLWCQVPGFIDDSPSKLPNHPEFAEHRHDQAILTCMAIKYGIKLHYWADERWYHSQRHRWPGDDYPLMFDHHRFRDKGKGGGQDPEWI